MNRFPSISEHDGVYNVDPENFRRGLLEPDEDFNEYHRSEENLPPLDWDEFKGAAAATYACLWKNAKLTGFSEEDAHSFYEFAVSDSIADRTVKVWLPDVRVLTPLLVQAIQREVLITRPLWRVLVGSDETARTVIIYPEVVRVGPSSEGADWRTELARVVREEWEHREQQEEPRRRQLDYVGERVCSSLPTVSNMPFELLAVFDNYNGDPSEWTAWVLFAGENAEDVNVDYTDGVMVSDKLPVREDGYFGPLFKDTNAKFWLRCWVYPPNTQKLTVKRQKDYKPIPGKLFMVTIRPEDIIRQAGLQPREKQG